MMNFFFKKVSNKAKDQVTMPEKITEGGAKLVDLVPTLAPKATTIPLLFTVQVQMTSPQNGIALPLNESETNGTGNASLNSSEDVALVLLDDCMSILIRVITLYITVHFLLSFMKKLDPTYEAKKRGNKKINDMMAKRGLRLPALSNHEMMIASKLVDPNDLATGWADIGGLDEILETTRKTVLGPIIARQNNSRISKLALPPLGVLFHGPPGCGKTSIAKAMAKESGCLFINIDASSLTDKYLGETEKLTSAMFSLATKLSPCMIFIDEIDSILRSRSNRDFDTTNRMKGLFMSLWDGLSTDSNAIVIVMGATNLPSSVDKAILRRMGTQVYVPYPGMIQRKQILELILRNENLDAQVSLEKLAELTDGLSGSDMKEVGRAAVVSAMDNSMPGISSAAYRADMFKFSSTQAKENSSVPRRIFSQLSYLLGRVTNAPKENVEVNDPLQLRFNSTKALTMADFESAITKVKTSRQNYDEESDPLTSTTDPTYEQKKNAKAKAKSIMDKLGVKGLSLSDHELVIASHLVNPDDMSMDWEDIGGLDDVIEKIKKTVMLPIIMQSEGIHVSKLLEPHKGVLLYGPPGCGKTSLAKAVAKDAQCWFINLEVSILADKYYGESEKLTAAIFSVAEKLQPCIVFVDEIDSLLRVRNTHDHETTALRKAQFMSLWDGLLTDPNKTVIVMGATNRPQDIDPAVLRRMTAKFHIPLPDVGQRIYILELILIDEDLASDFNLEELASLTEGFSGSDLKDVAKFAALQCLTQSHSTSGHNGGGGSRASSVAGCGDSLFRKTQLRSRLTGGGGTEVPNKGHEKVATRGGNLGMVHLRKIKMEDFKRGILKVIESRGHCKF